MLHVVVVCTKTLSQTQAARFHLSIFKGVTSFNKAVTSFNRSLEQLFLSQISTHVCAEMIYKWLFSGTIACIGFECFQHQQVTSFLLLTCSYSILL